MASPNAQPPTAFIVGWPVEHSRSPLIHGYWLKQHGLDGAYIKKPCAPDQFDDFIVGLPSNGLVGGNVTMPHK